ncbi:hypothetical protein VTK56DRAFT_8146 [Thermocarpiscus australiensis]
MGSVESATPAAITMPTVKLDTTISELYKRASPSNASARLGWLSCGVTSAIDITPDFPRNTEFLYQDQAFNAIPRRDLRRDNVELQRSLAKKYLSLIPQRDAFITGHAPVILFNANQTPAQVEHDLRQAEATISVLDPSQRPELIFCPGPSKIPIKEHAIDRLMYKVILDGLDSYPLTHPLETHWLLNSKAGLARSGLPTPPSQLIEPEGFPPASAAATTCCAACAAAASHDDDDDDDDHHHQSTLPVIPATCTGPRGRWLTAQAARILDAVRARPAPFVFKTQQAFGGAGTWLVGSDEAKQRLLADLLGHGSDGGGDGDGDGDDGDGLLRKLLSQVTPANAHLAPAAVLLCEMVRDVVGDYGLTFVVGDDGNDDDDRGEGAEFQFLAATEQMMAEEEEGEEEGGEEATGTRGSASWVGSRINYARQAQLQRKFAPLMRRVAEWVARHGYVGPVGVDVLESREGALYVVDLNVRTCGSLSLPLLRGHFVSRGLGCASSFSITFKGTRAEFVERWKAQFEEGRMLILSWYEDPGAGESIADVVVGGEDEKRLQEVMKSVKDATEEVTF